MLGDTKFIDDNFADNDLFNLKAGFTVRRGKDSKDLGVVDAGGRKGETYVIGRDGSIGSIIWELFSGASLRKGVRKLSVESSNGENNEYVILNLILTANLHFFMSS